MNATEKKLYAKAIEVAKEANEEFVALLEDNRCIGDEELRRADYRMHVVPAANTLCAQLGLICRVFCVSEDEVHLAVGV